MDMCYYVHKPQHFEELKIHLILYKIYKIGKSIEIESRLVVSDQPGTEGGGYGK